MTGRVIVAAVVMSLWAAPGTGQTAGESVGLATGVQVETYRFSEGGAVSSLSLLTIPVSASVQLGRRAAIGLSGFWARGVTRQGGLEATIAGPTDTQISATVKTGDGMASITGVVLLPTGHSTHTAEEASVAALVSSDLLLFRVSNWGTGGGVGLRAATRRRVGELGAGLSVGYFLGQDFNPIEAQDFAYRPGNNLVVRAALDRSIGVAGKASLQLTFRRYASDRLDGSNLFRSGNRYQAIGSYAFALGRTASAVAYGGASHRTRGAFLVDPRPTGAQTYFVMGAGGRLRVGRALVMPTVDLRALRTAQGLHEGFDGRAGVAVEVPLGTTTLIPTARVHLGRVALVEGVSSRFVGADLGLTVRLGR